MSARLLQLFILNVLICVATPTDNVTGNGTYDNHTTHAPEDHKKSHGVHIVELKYEELRELLIFTIVVLLAGLSKVGKYLIILPMKVAKFWPVCLSVSFLKVRLVNITSDSYVNMYMYH